MRDPHPLSYPNQPSKRRSLVRCAPCCLRGRPENEFDSRFCVARSHSRFSSASSASSAVDSEPLSRKNSDMNSFRIESMASSVLPRSLTDKTCLKTYSTSGVRRKRHTSSNLGVPVHSKVSAVSSIAFRIMATKETLSLSPLENEETRNIVSTFETMPITVPRMSAFISSSSSVNFAARPLLSISVRI